MVVSGGFSSRWSHFGRRWELSTSHMRCHHGSKAQRRPLRRIPCHGDGFGMGSIHFCFGFTHSVHHEECVEVSPTRGSFLHPPVLCSWPPLH